MRLNLLTALSLALLTSMIPGCNRTATDAEEAASKGGTTGQASEGSSNDRKAPARPASK
jgi:hypothetical protein